MTGAPPEGLRWHDCASSNVRRVACGAGPTSGDPCDIYVEFLNGGIYCYRGAPYAVYEGLRAAPSVGGYVARHLRGQYPTDRLDRRG